MGDVVQKKRSTVMVVGNAIVDTIIDVDDGFLERMHLTKGDMRMVDRTFFTNIFESYHGDYTHIPGGSAANTLFLLGQLGHPTRLVAVVGDDSYGKLYHEALAKLAGDHRFIYKHKELPTGQCFSLVTEDRDRTMCTDIGASSMLSVDQCPVESFGGVNLVHIEGYLAYNLPVLMHVLDEAKRAGIFISTSISSASIAREFRELFLETVLPRSDVMFANAEEATILTGTKTPEESLEALCGVVPTAVVTLSEDGAMACRGKERAQKKAPRVVPVDATGAGDAFAGGFLHGMLADHTLEHALAWGVAAGSKAVVTRGARLSDEDILDLKKQLTT